MKENAAGILSDYNFRQFRPGENDATFKVDGGGVFVIACEQPSPTTEIRFSLLWADKSADAVLDAAKEALRQDWSQYCPGYRFALLAKIDDPHKRSQAVLDLRAHCTKGSK